MPIMLQKSYTKLSIVNINLACITIDLLTHCTRYGLSKKNYYIFSLNL